MIYEWDTMSINNSIIFGDNLTILKTFPDACIDLIYIDPPFNTGKPRKKVTLKTDKDMAGTRIGFGDNRYRSQEIKEYSFDDRYSSYPDFLNPRLVEAYRILKDTGSILVHLDYREVHYCKVFLDSLFGRACFQNEIIWAYDFGARSKKCWPAKHDNILWYSKDPKRYTFNYDEIDRVPYLAPSLVGKVKAARGKTITDVHWHTIVPTNGKEKTGYPTQKPLGLLRRFVRVHSNPGEILMDFFCGSGTLGEAAGEAGRSFVLVDNNLEAVGITSKRLSKYAPTLINF